MGFEPFLEGTVFYFRGESRQSAGGSIEERKKTNEKEDMDRQTDKRMDGKETFQEMAGIIAGDGFGLRRSPRAAGAGAIWR